MTLQIGRMLKQSKLTQAALADAIDVSRGYMSEIVSGKKTPSLDTLNRIADALNVSPADLYNNKPTAFAEDPASFKNPGSAELFHQENNTVANALRALTPATRHAQTFKTSTNLPAFALRDGDLLMVEMNGQPKEGDLVIATMTDLETGTGVTDVLLWAPPWCISGDGSNSLSRLGDDGALAIMGVVRATVRANHL